MNRKKETNFDSDDFGPANVASVFVPTRRKFPSAPSPLKTTPTPHDEEASTQNSTGETGGGFESTEPQKDDVSCILHQLISAKTVALGVLRIKGDDKWLKEVAKRDKEGRRERP